MLEHKEQFRRVQVNESIRDSIQRVYDPKIFATQVTSSLETIHEPPVNPPNTIAKHSLQTQVIHNSISKNNTTANRLEVHEIVTKMTHNKLAQPLAMPKKQSSANPMDYLEVVDEYSSHEFLMRKGQVLRDTPEFQSFMRLHSQTWHQV